MIAILTLSIQAFSHGNEVVSELKQYPRQEIKECLRKSGKLKKDIELRKKIIDLFNFNIGNLNVYKLKQIRSPIIDEFCKSTLTTAVLQKYSGLSSLCKTYNLGKIYIDWASKDILKKSSGLNAQYKTFLSTSLENCYRSMDSTLIDNWNGVSTFILKKKSAETVLNIMKMQALNMCRKIVEYKKQIVKIEGYCKKVPNVIGRPYQLAKNNLNHEGFYDIRFLYKLDGNTIDLSKISDKESEVWFVKSQDPPAGTYASTDYPWQPVFLYMKRLPRKILFSEGAKLKLVPGEKHEIHLFLYLKAVDSFLGTYKVIRKDITHSKLANIGLEGCSNIKFSSGRLLVNNKVDHEERCYVVASYSEEGKIFKSRLELSLIVPRPKALLLESKDGVNITSKNDEIRLSVGLKYDDGKIHPISISDTDLSFKILSGCAEIKDGKLNFRRCCKRKPISLIAEYRGMTSKPLKLRWDKDIRFVPDLKGKTVKKALEILKKLSLNSSVVYRKNFDPSYNIDEVLFQSPAPCRTVKKDTNIHLTANPSKKDGKIIVPDLMGKSIDQAKQFLRSINLRPVLKITNQFPANIYMNRVVAQKPLPGTSVVANSQIILYYVPNMVKVPDLIGKDGDMAKTILSKSGLMSDVSISKNVNKNYRMGAVISQNPSPGTLVPFKSFVRLLVNKTKLPRARIVVVPKKTFYHIKERIKFCEGTLDKNPNSVYSYEWWVDGKSVGTGGCIEKAFDEPGDHSVWLNLDSSDTRENDVASIIVKVRDVRPECAKWHITCNPKNPHKEEQVSCMVHREFRGRKCSMEASVSTFVWVIDGEEVGTGRMIHHVFHETGRHEVKVFIKGPSNADSIVKIIQVDEEPLRPLGKWRNRFLAKQTGHKVIVYSIYWIGGSGEWSKPKYVGETDNVMTYRLETTPQTDGWNTGYLVYIDRWKKLRFKVYYFAFGNEFVGKYAYGGYIDSIDEVDPGSLYLEPHKYCMRVHWRKADGSRCQTCIWKYKPAKTTAFNRGTAWHTGVDEPECERPSRVERVSGNRGITGGERINHPPSCYISFAVPGLGDTKLWTFYTPGDPDGDPVTYRWKVESGIPSTASGRKIFIERWMSEGKHPIRVLGKDSHGATCANTLWVTVKGLSKREGTGKKSSWDETTICRIETESRGVYRVGQPIHFTVNSDRRLENYHWEIEGEYQGDTIGRSVQIVWNKPGFYRIAVHGEKDGYSCQDVIDVEIHEKSIDDSKEDTSGMKKPRDNTPSVRGGQRKNGSSIGMKGFSEGMEYGYDRLGYDYKNFDMSMANPKLCKEACEKEPKCRAWTYVKPNTFQGPNPRCWLKYRVPNKTPNPDCISGVKKVNDTRAKATQSKSDTEMSSGRRASDSFNNPSVFRLGAESWFANWRVIDYPKDQTGKIGKIFNSEERFGWKSSARKIGDAMPPSGSQGAVLYLHPVSRDKPARMLGHYRVPRGESYLKFRVSGNQNGDWSMRVKINGKEVFHQLIDGHSWHTVSIPLRSYQGQEVQVELLIEANGWYFEYAYIDNIELIGKRVQVSGKGASYHEE